MVKIALAHFGISVSNIEKAVDWYSNTFGFALVKQFAKPELQIKGAIMTHGDCTLEILQPDEGKKSTTAHGSLAQELRRIGANHIALSVDDVRALYAECRADNIDLVTDLMDQRFFFCKDPEGTLIEVRQGS